MGVTEFHKNVVQEEFNMNYDKYLSNGIEIEAIEFLTGLILMSVGPLESKIEGKVYLALFEFYKFEEEEVMTPDEFYICIDKSLRAICHKGQIQIPYVEKESLEDFRDEVTQDECITYETFRSIIMEECEKFANVFQESYNFLRMLSTHIVENPFPVISFLQPGNLFLGKYEITNPPKLIEEISSNYKKKYKHSLLQVKPMLGEEGKLTFELIYLSGINGDKSFRQNYFREIVLKNKLTKGEMNEFGELPGGILYKSISELEATQMTLGEYFEEKFQEMETKNSDEPRRKIVCMNEIETISLGLKLLDELEVLHSINVLHSNINPSSVYLIEQDINRLRFLDLELAIWDPIEILGSESAYFQQLVGDKYDTTFRDINYLSPEHEELAKQYQKAKKVPEEGVSKQCDIYSIGAILFKALTGKAPVNFSEDTKDHPSLHEEERDWLEEFECPEELDPIAMSNGMAQFLLKILAKDTQVRHKDIMEAKRELSQLVGLLERIPKLLMKGLEHIPHNNHEMFEDDYVLDLHEEGINDFCLEYLYKFITESRIPNIRMFGNIGLPIRALASNSIDKLELSSQNIYAEELKLLSFFIKINTSLLEVDLSKNPLLQRHSFDKQENEEDASSEGKTTMGFSWLLEALESHSQLKRLELAQVELGEELANQLCVPIAKNLNLEKINLANCELGVEGTMHICNTVQNMKNLRYINLSSNDIGDQGAKHVAKLLETNHHILEIDLFRNNIAKEGGEAIGAALTNNFIIQKLSIGDNEIEQNEKDLILQSVMFNTQYKKLKATNERFGEFGYNLMAESIKRWTEKSKFVLEKLRARLHQCEDEIDQKLAELLLDSEGNLEMPEFSSQLSQEYS